MNWKRVALLVAGSLVTVVLLGAGVLTYLVLRLDVRGEIERNVEAATGRDLTISGNVGVSYWPVLGLKAEDVTLANVEGGRAPAFIAADEIDIGVELRPLLDRQVNVRRLVFQRPRVALEVDANGQPNWLLRPRVSTTPPPTTTPPPEGPVDVQRTSLRSVRINDGEVSFFDARQGAGWVAGEVDITTALTSLDQPMRAQGSVLYNDRKVEIDANIARPGAAIRGELTQVVLNIESELLSAEFRGQTVATSGELAGTVRATGPSLRQLASWSGTPLQNAVGLEQFAVTGRLVVGGGAYTFSNAGFAVDQVRGRGDFVLSEVRNKPYLSGRLELFDFDLNPYISGQAPPPVSEEQAVVAAAMPDAGSAGAPPTAEIATVEAAPRAVDVREAPSETPIDFAGLRALNADLELVTHAVLIQHMRIESSRLNLVLNDGFMAATVHNVSLYGGSGRGRFEIDARELSTRMAQDLAFTNLDAQRFLTDSVNFSGIEGRAELSLNIRVEGRTQSEMINSMDGYAHMEVVSGTLHGVDLGGVATTIRNALRGELIAPEARTPFDGFSSTFAIADGVLASDSVSFNTNALRIPGLVVIDLPGRRLDARLAPRSPRGGVVVPFAARGPFGQLTYAHDISGRALADITTRVAQVEAASRASARPAQ